MPTIYLRLRAEVKEDRDMPPAAVTPELVASGITDDLLDRTKHEAELDWRIISVDPAPDLTRRVAELYAALSEVLAAFHDTKSDGWRARAGRVQMRRWEEVRDREV
jgi:hypothetical protein